MGLHAVIGYSVIDTVTHALNGYASSQEVLSGPFRALIHSDPFCELGPHDGMTGCISAFLAMGHDSLTA